MWCPNCQADVAAEVSPDNRRIRCASCGTELTTTHYSTPPETTREARDLLNRWSAGDILDPPSPPPSKKPHFRVDPPHTPPESFHPHSQQQRPKDQAPPEPVGTPAGSGQSPPPAFTPPPSHTAPPQPPTPPTPNTGGGQSPPPAWNRVDSAHSPTLRGPHFDVQTIIEQNQQKKTNWVSLIGQLLAYAGVVLLTVGTSVLLSGHFGGPDQYTPTGWLIATVGQMLLFLGVVTLVSCGMEQTSDEVSQRVETLGAHIIRMEQATNDMRISLLRSGSENPPPSGPMSDAA